MLHECSITLDLVLVVSGTDASFMDTRLDRKPSLGSILFDETLMVTALDGQLVW